METQIENQFAKSEVGLNETALGEAESDPGIFKEVQMTAVVVDKGERGEMTRSETIAHLATKTPICLSWDNVGYAVELREGCKKKKKKLQILHGVSGVVKPGEMLAIIGGSGAGKSTLLDILANRKSTGDITGAVMMNGKELKDLKNLLKRVTGYVTQEDIVKAELSVREVLQFTAELRLDPRTFSKEEKKARVERVMQQLGIEHRAEMKVGNETTRGLSGGEKKRLAIGIELVTDPSVLYLDEPTSGLDAYNSLAVMRLLNELCKMGKTVVTTIHQPRSTIFDMFDQLLVLNQGRSVYLGPAKNATSYFDRIGFTIPPQMNPADYVIDVLLDPDRASMTVKDVSSLDFAATYAQSPEYQKAAQGIQEAATEYTNLEAVEDIKPYATNGLKQFSELARRHVKGTFRNPLASVVAIVQSVTLAFIVGSIFYQLGYTQPDIQSRAGALFFILINGAFGISQSAGLFIEERLLVNRERASGMYGALPYFLSRSLIDIPVQLLSVSCFLVIMYWMANLNPAAERFFTMFGIVVSQAFCVGGLIALIGAVSPNITVGNILVPVVLVLFFLFAGFFVNASTIPDWWIWLYYISFFRYSYQAAVVNEFAGTTFFCPVNTTSGCVSSGDQVIVNFDAQGTVVWQWVVVLLSMGVIYRIITYLVVQFLHKEKR